MLRLILIGMGFLLGLPIDGWCDRVLLDEGWRFHVGEAPGAETTEYDHSDWCRVDLPHDWSIESAPEPNAPSGGAGGYHATGVGWYRHDLPARPAGERWRLEFEGAYRHATVWLNGVELGTKAYGYTPFAFDLTEQASIDRPNVIAVKIDNSEQPNCRWYSGSGLYRHVWLRTTTGDLAIQPGSVWTRSEDLSAESAEVTVALAVESHASDDKAAEVQVSLATPDGEVVATHSHSVSLSSRDSESLEFVLKVPNPHSWSPDSPFLYELRVELVSSGKEVLDTTIQRIGLRTITIDAERGMLLNGKAIELFGGNVHHDHGPLGAASFDLAEQRRVGLLKEAGFNSVRTSHNPPSEAFLDACDRQGLLVIDEAFDGWRKNKTPHDYGVGFDASWRDDLTAMVERDRRHPSVVMWSLGNEMYERGEESGVELAQELAAHVQELDDSRPVTAGVNGLGKGAWSGLDRLFAALDVAGYNYEIARFAEDHARLPKRVMYCSESYPTDAFKSWQATTSQTAVIGDFVWSAIDYLGEAGIGRAYPPGETPQKHWEADHFPWRGAACGDVDLLGRRKPISHYRNIVWDRGEKLFHWVVQPAEGAWGLTPWAVEPGLASWTWDVPKGRPMIVRVASRWPKVKLLLNEQTIGEAETGADQEFLAEFETPYQPGDLIAVGLDQQGVEQERIVLSSAGPASELRLATDTKEDTLNSGRQAIAFVDASVRDAKGRLQPTADQVIEFTVRGPAEIIAVGNSDLTSPSRYTSQSVSTYQGRAQVAVRSTGQPGVATIEATSEGLPTASVSLRFVP